MFVLLKEEAQKILDAFGPCTTLYECSSANDLVREAGDDFNSLPEMLDCLLRVESIHDDRFIGGMHDAGVSEDWEIKTEVEFVHQRQAAREQALKLLFGYVRPAGGF
jgi:hypothetical protein